MTMAMARLILKRFNSCMLLLRPGIVANAELMHKYLVCW